MHRRKDMPVLGNKGTCKCILKPVSLPAKKASEPDLRRILLSVSAWCQLAG